MQLKYIQSVPDHSGRAQQPEQTGQDQDGGPVHRSPDYQLINLPPCLSAFRPGGLSTWVARAP